MDVTEKEVVVFGWLIKNEDRPTVARLAEILGIGKMAVSRALLKLERLGAISAERMDSSRHQIRMISVKVIMTPEELQDRLNELSPLSELVETE